MIYTEIEKALLPFGLICRGGFALSESDGLGTANSLLLIGNAGPSIWRSFQKIKDGPFDGKKNKADGGHPLDHWTRSLIDPIACEFEAQALYPFDGPPYHPFQRWAMRAEPVFSSPIGPLVHPVYGLWHAYRGALIFEKQIDFPEIETVSAPCETCAEKPCLTRCPVGAFGPQTYDVPACVSHLSRAPKVACRTGGCLARHGCPIGQNYAYLPQQAEFHMDKFVESQRRRPV